MSWDIFGNPLQRGHCEVHPHVHEEYPCSVCISEKRQHDQPSCDGRCENALYLAQADDHIKSLQARMAELEKREAAYDIILKVVSNALERAGVTECDNPGDAIEMITKERDGLLSQLPEGMKHCTIIFKECDKGHGWLTATNWVQHGCPKCEFDRIVDEKHELQRLRRQSSNMVSALHLEACQWRIKAEKAEQERDGLAAKCAELSSAIRSVNRGKQHKILIDGDDEPCYWQRKEWVDWIVGLANQIEREGCEQWENSND